MKHYCISEDTSFPSTPAALGDVWPGFVAVPLRSAAALWLSLAGCQDHLQMLDEISGRQTHKKNELLSFIFRKEGESESEVEARLGILRLVACVNS